MSTTVSDTTISIQPETVEHFWGLREKYGMRISPAHTGGAFQLTEVMVWPGGGPPPHVHRHEDEAFYVLDGDMEFLLGDRLVEATTGDFVWAPRGVVHQFRTRADTPAHFLVWIGPGNLETMFRQFSSPCEQTDMAPPPVDPSLPPKILATAQTFGIDFAFDATPTTRETIPPAPGLWVLGAHVKLLGTGAATDNRLCVVEITVPQGVGPLPHLHREQSETFHVIEGSVEVTLGEATVTARAGATIYIPPGVVHAFRGTAEAPSRLLSIHSPAGMEAFFRECGVEGPLDQPPQVGLPDPQRLLDILRRHGMELPAR